jgi:hypothetical protein
MPNIAKLIVTKADQSREIKYYMLEQVPSLQIAMQLASSQVIAIELEKTTTEEAGFHQCTTCHKYTLFRDGGGACIPCSTPTEKS